MMDTVKRIPVIETTIARKGSGDGRHSPIRILTQYWTDDGQLLASVDPCAATLTPEALQTIKEQLGYAFDSNNEAVATAMVVIRQVLNIES
jgi:hypothetical protein